MLRKAIAAWQKKGLPRRFAALRWAHASYSQLGEDVMLQAVWGSMPEQGRYLDIGCNHPIRWSNTYRLYLRGWRGVGVDMIGDYGPLWARYRPGDVFIEGAVSRDADEVQVLRNDSHLNESRVVVVEPGDGETGSTVSAVSLATLMEEHFKEEPCRVLSVDCEGHDLEVLKSNDWTRFRPYALVVEDHGDVGATELHQFCREQGYILVATLRYARIYCDESR